MPRSLFLACALLVACRSHFDDVVGAGGDASADAKGDPSAVKLATKHIYGPPGGSFTIAFAGGDPSNLTLRFIDAAHRVVHASPVAANGGITLPSVAGLYEVELRDPTTGGISFAQATVTLPVASFTSVQQMTLPAYGPYAPQWPVSLVMAADLDEDGHPDLIRASGMDDVGMLAAPGVYTHRWGVGATQLGTSVATPLDDRMMCGAVMFDVDQDGDTDLVTVAQRISTYEVETCILSNTSGTFTPSCTTEPATMQDWFSCRGGVVAADFDRDGRIDLAIAGGRLSGTNFTTREVRLLANRSGGFQLAGSWSTPSTDMFGSIAVADFNDDGRLDVIANGGAPSRLHVFLATDDFVLAEPAQYAAAQGDFMYDEITAAYVDANATLDVFLSHADGPSTLFTSDGTTLTAAAIPTFTEQHGTHFHVLDYDTDGEEDVIIPFKNRYLQTNRFGGLHAKASMITAAMTPSAANTIAGQTPTTSWVYSNFVFDDFDRDGKLDAVLLSAYTRELELLRGN